MYGFLWRKLPGNAPLRALQCLLLFLAAVFVLFQFVFPKLEPLLPFGDVTVNGTGTGTGSTAPPSPGPSASTSTLNGAHRLPVAELFQNHGVAA
ncbi:hypothetical protein DN069_14380 [Streptacidiphilus pinicola]|uniref:Uncharacterized protein n=1 Tax=Streptacidiphilus pinicola TaxID=2219663 RepID=A0A2X0III4_9ACTN|nr:hypothetical protein [Streptacidiphilus pinicola]RAG84904.1 hypothetical protein DN069_14380 [Streptacidiphilus pinicola]